MKRDIDEEGYCSERTNVQRATDFVVSRHVWVALGCASSRGSGHLTHENETSYGRMPTDMTPTCFKCRSIRSSSSRVMNPLLGVHWSELHCRTPGAATASVTSS